MKWIHPVVPNAYLSLFCMESSLLWQLIYIIKTKHKQDQNYGNKKDTEKRKQYKIHEQLLIYLVLILA